MAQLAPYLVLALLFGGCGAFSTSTWWHGALVGIVVGAGAARTARGIISNYRG
jgi:hypothetical protein